MKKAAQVTPEMLLNKQDGETVMDIILKDIQGAENEPKQKDGIIENETD